jgi:hypothetical protein
LYKITPIVETASGGGGTTSNKYKYVKFYTNAFESFNTSLSTPVSPMPLPEENSRENLLVKMEGNSQQVRFSCKFSTELVTVQNATILGTQIVYDGTFIDVDHYINSTTPIVYSPLLTTTNNISLLTKFLEAFENRSISDTFIVRIIDTTTSESLMRYGGSIVNIDCTLDSGSPVVWSVNIDFMVGNVVSIYDADTPEEPTNFAVNVEPPAGAVNGKVTYSWTDPSNTGGSSITAYMLSATCLGKTKQVTAQPTTAQVTVVGSTKSFYIQSGSFLIGENWEFHMYAYNTNGRGLPSKSIESTF